MTPSDGSKTDVMFRFGMYPDNNNGHQAEDAAIRDATGLSSVFDIPTIQNIDYNLKKADGSRYNYVNDETYLDSTQSDGYKKLDAGYCESDYNGKRKTALVVEHANKIIDRYLEKKIPTMFQELADALQAIIAENASQTNSWRYDEYYYPAVYGCYLYQPKVTGALTDIYKAKNWYCPSEGELCRLYNFFRNGVSKAVANFNAANEATTPIMANANYKANATIFTFINNAYWSVSESYANYSWNLNFGNGYLYYTNKCNSCYVRPCTAFDFLL